MHSGDMSELSQSTLTEQEKEALLQVMERAKEFDRQSNIEGQLHKWTNPLKGWQPRWFNVDHQQGVLHYYTAEDKKKQAPRGSLHLWGAVVSPSEEDSQSFSVNGANGEIYKLRGQDAKERQFWVSRLRREVEHCTTLSFNQVGVGVNTGGSCDEPTTAATTTISPGHKMKRMSLKIRQSNKMVATPATSNASSAVVDTSMDDPDYGRVDQFPGGDGMLEVLTRLQALQESFSNQLQTCSKHAGLSPTDKEVLLLRATSHAAVISVKDCLALMKANSLPQSPLDMPKHSIADSRESATETNTSVTEG